MAEPISFEQCIAKHLDGIEMLREAFLREQADKDSQIVSAEALLRAEQGQKVQLREQNRALLFKVNQLRDLNTRQQDEIAKLKHEKQQLIARVSRLEGHAMQQNFNPQLDQKVKPQMPPQEVSAFSIEAQENHYHEEQIEELE